MATNLSDYMASLPEDEQTAIRKRSAELREEMIRMGALKLPLGNGYVGVDRNPDGVGVEFEGDRVRFRLLMTYEEARNVDATILAAADEEGGG
ncbi:MAG: hypothetical protein P4L85_15110 [Paludisphaera borealis]|uniref:hypothetical protein n=1 Tax=Paludisphaera borealis TaxID=1387353 RepID=UPI00283E8A5A|nr:hypothetical protein [Paludisphaera borealis]MDR3620680.1 hypothetical protein [Paludisphaera borealis]